MATIVKLTTAGEAVTMQVKSCEKNTVGQYPGYLFSGKNERGDFITIEIPESSTTRQLTRLELTPATVVGRTVRISRDPNASNAAKPYWGISLVDAAEGVDGDDTETGAPPPAKAPPATPAVKKVADDAQAITGRYLRLLDHVAAHVKKETGAEFLDYATSQPIAATIWIELSKRNLT